MADGISVGIWKSIPRKIESLSLVFLSVDELFALSIFLLQFVSDPKLGCGGTARNTTLVCVPLVSKSVEQMLDEMRRAKSSGADIVEIRLDHLQSFRPRTDLEILLKDRVLPALVTYRSACSERILCWFSILG